MATIEDIKKKAEREEKMQMIESNLGIIRIKARQIKNPEGLDKMLSSLRDISGLGSPVPVSTN